MVLPDVYLDQDKPEELYAKAGLDAKGIVAKVFEALGGKNQASRQDAGVSRETALPMRWLSPRTRLFFASRAKAREAIDGGIGPLDGAILTKASGPVGEDAHLEAERALPLGVARRRQAGGGAGGLRIDPSGKSALDIGASTGGFADVLLSRGAAHVTCVDVGHGQLHQRIASDPRVASLEHFDARG